MCLGMFKMSLMESLRGEVWYWRRCFKSQGGRETLAIAESWIAKIVELDEEKMISGEI